jgi:CelD/BcsL family acetyltransferase involved in cellulose biosynthesis
LDSYLKMLTAKNRQRFRRTLRNFEAWVGKGGYELRRATDQTSLATGWRILNNLHGRRWRADGVAGAFAAERFGRFHCEYTQKTLQSGQLDLVWLMASGRPLAAMYNIKTSHKIYFYQGGRDINLPENISIGSVIIALVIQDAISNGYQEFDFMAGEIDYKKRFTSTMRPLVELRAVRPTLREVLRSQLKGARSYLRAMGFPPKLTLGRPLTQPPPEATRAERCPAEAKQLSARGSRGWIVRRDAFPRMHWNPSRSP